MVKKPFMRLDGFVVAILWIVGLYGACLELNNGTCMHSCICAFCERAGVRVHNACFACVYVWIHDRHRVYMLEFVELHGMCM